MDFFKFVHDSKIEGRIIIRVGIRVVGMIGGMMRKNGKGVKGRKVGEKARLVFLRRVMVKSLLRLGLRLITLLRTPQ